MDNTLKIDFDNFDFDNLYNQDEGILENKNILYIHNNENVNVNKMYSFFKEFKTKEVLICEDIEIAINKIKSYDIRFVVIEDSFIKHNTENLLNQISELFDKNKIIIFYKNIKNDLLNKILLNDVTNIIFNFNDLNNEFKNIIEKINEKEKNKIKIENKEKNNNNNNIINTNQNKGEDLENLTYILNYQENLISIIEDKKIILRNNSFLSFLGKRNLDDLNSEENLFDNIFMKEKGYIYSDERSWLEKILEDYNTNLDFKVKMYDKFNSCEKVFLLKITMIPSYNEKYLIELTDISKTIEIQEYYEEKAYVDNLTKIFNRQKITLELNKLTKSKTNYSILFLDIDYFKKINDNYGHDVGDDVLKKVANVLNYSIRKGDLLGRWGGEEFLAILPNASPEKTIEIAERLRGLIEKTRFENIKQVTISIGASNLNTFDTRREEVIKRADEALYKSKQNGRNQVNYI